MKTLTLSILLALSANAVAGTCIVTPGCRMMWNNGAEVADMEFDSPSSDYTEPSLASCYNRAVNFAEDSNYIQVENPRDISSGMRWKNPNLDSKCYTLVTWIFRAGLGIRGRVNAYTATYATDGPKDGDRLFKPDGSPLFKGTSAAWELTP